MSEPSATDLLLLACELATRVECRPERRDGSDAAVYESSGATLARRIRAGAPVTASYREAAPFSWTVALQAGAARKTNYQLWLRESPAELKALWQARAQARALRESLPHAQRKKKPWGPL
ncbi:hypothetical protein LZ009_19920 [Ramlibacter sp. XY19]|uniref:hypothetical protein n=1 Tax=Ramlibacter paludis TaxID=2908000 RepID=UPI0023DA3E03|nr:hypothetical protein [Ramlibacter paludis]MCG2595052.1 hypothetical protein [Ramlibacter paludis]